MRGIDGIIYINLDHRTDRRELIEHEFKRLAIPQEKIHRLSAAYDQLNGTKGCLLSHIKALEFAEEKGWDRVLILEDDSLFISDLETIEMSLDSFYHAVGNQWDVLFLGGTYREKETTPWEGLLQIREGLCSHAYLIQRSYVDKLKACFLSSFFMIKDHLFTTQSLIYSLDQVWKVLQRADRWYAWEQQSILQRMDQSDIDIVPEPLNRFLRVVYIDTGNKERLLKEFQRLRLDMGRVHRVENQLEAIEKAIELGRSNVLIVEDTAVFPQNFEVLDLKIIHFFRWVAHDWNLFLLDDQNCDSTETRHPYFRKVTKISRPKIYAVHETFYENLLSHFKKGQGLDTLQNPSQRSIYCIPLVFQKLGFPYKKLGASCEMG